MASVGGAKISPAVQPKPQDYDYDLDRALASVVGLRANVPADAFTAETLGSERVVVAGAGGRQHSVAARIVAKEEFAGNWEYVLDEAIFTAPAHPNWGGTALIGPAGDLIGIGSLQIQQASPRSPSEHLNMIVP